MLTWPSLSDGKGACIEVAFIAMACIKSNCTEGTSVSGSGAVECLEMYLQSFQILRVKLFGT